MADRPVLPEIEITPEMMEAGAIAFSGYDPNFDNQTLMNELTDFLKIDRFKFSFHNANLSHKYNKKVTYEYNKPDYASEISMYEKKLYEEFEK